MSLVSFGIKNLRQFKKDLERDQRQIEKAGHTAARVEGYRLSSELKTEIKAGAPGGRKFSPLTEIARRMRRPMNRTPLKRLAIPVRYAARMTGQGFEVAVGFVDPGRGKALSKSWKRIAIEQQEGFTRSPAQTRRLAIIRTAARLGKRARGRQKLFLRKSTRRFKTPGRPIIDPFWMAHKNEAKRNIRYNFERKMAGERI